MANVPRCSFAVGVLSVAIGFLCLPPAVCEEAQFVRGAVNRDADVDLSDAVSIFGFLFLGAEAPDCLDAADANDSGDLDITDGVYLLLFLYRGGYQIPAPYPNCGFDGTDDGLDCGSFVPCDGP